MNRFTIDTFLYVNDYELTMYKILDGLKIFKNDFNHSKLYPGLSDLIELNLELKDMDSITLREIYADNNKSRSKDDRLLIETVEITDEYIDDVLKLIEWAAPLIQETIEEGKVLYEFVKKNINIEEIGIADLTKDEGYVLIPNNKERRLQVMHYEIAMSDEDGKISRRKLHTQLLQSLEKNSIDESPEEAIMDLFKIYTDMPATSTFICNTDLDFPFTETILPVVKRKLMSRMAA